MKPLAVVLLAAGCAAAPALHEADFERISNGMSGEDVRRTLGEPTRTEAFPLQKQVAWTYAYVDLWGYFAFTSVLFDDGGRVVGKAFTRKEPED